MTTNDSTVFRTKQEHSTEDHPLAQGTPATVSGDVTIDVPFLDYRNQHSHPFMADHYALGDTWNDPVGGFPKEVATIESYIQAKINDGELANDTQAVKDYLKGLEKVNNLHKETRTVIKLETLSAYIKFLQETDEIKLNARRYANT